jgi:hypothetical protein
VALENTLEVLVPLSIEMVNLVLLLVLMHTFWVNYRRLRSSFTRGLLLFVIAFFLKSILSIGYLGFILINIAPDEHFPGGFLPFVFNIFETVALVVLIRVTRE